MNILALVEAYDVITIFRHTAADQDALGSQFGLKHFLKSAYPKKEIYALGEDLGGAANLFPSIDKVDDEKIKKSIAFVLDTADTSRIDDKRYQMADKIIKIDHHIIVEDYADESYIDTSAAATCEILAFLIQKSGVNVSKECAQYLYYGLLADSIAFTTTNTTSNTLSAAAFLVSCGLNVSEIAQKRCGMSENEFRYISDIRTKVQVNGKVAYSIMREKDYMKYGLSYNQAKEKVFALSNVNEFEMWCLFTEDSSYGEENLYNGSLRSKQIAINQVANQFGGGGHKNACGVKKLTLHDIERLVDTFNNL